MILAIDIGNTNIVIGCIDKNKTHFIERVSTDRSKTELEYAIVIKNVLDLYQIPPSTLEGGIVCSVVPQITGIVRIATEKILQKEVMVLGPGIKTGMNILMDNPAQVGSDLIADAVGAINEYPTPLIIFDMGTATTVCVVDSKKNYIGGMIIPGIRTALDALTARAAQLSGIELVPPKRVIGKNTIECMRSGIITSNAAAVDGIVERMEEELGEKATVVATGGLAKTIIPFCKKQVILDEDLLLKGLLCIYEKNKA
ncbi:MAG: type III pantothenate kinase [Lachnospiraceae bacterium]|nr:type III pantothenate kinase [Lachnospiraceae bacterium]